MPIAIKMPDGRRRTIVFGGRDFIDRDWLFRTLDGHHAARPFDCIIQGGQVSIDPTERRLPWDRRKKWGADWFAREWALSRGVPMIEEKARWRTEGKAAGPLRNQRMIDKHDPTEGIGFPGGRGSADMLRRIKAADLEWITHASVDRNPEGQDPKGLGAKHESAAPKADAQTPSPEIESEISRLQTGAVR